MLLLDKNTETRWAISDGPLAICTTGTAVTATCNSISAEAVVADGIATLKLADAIKLMSACGCYEIVWDCGTETVATLVERVGRRYCTSADVVEYGIKNNDGFDDATRYPPEAITAAIQQAEETIEDCTRRSFCARCVNVVLSTGLNELPVQDVVDVDSEVYDRFYYELVSDRQVRADRAGMVTIHYGAKPDARIREATVRLAASSLRPRLAAENARGQSVDGVYTSYTLATGAEGAWTGIPYVDAVIEGHRSHRVVIA